jgi:NADH-quinone oxidoreductase subunit E
MTTSGWVSDDGLQDLAEFLDMTAEELDSVATFYSLIFRRPVGRHVILICDSISCWIMGYENLRAHLAARLGIGLGETSEDGRFTLLPIPCLGTCDHAPAMMIDEELYLDLTREKIDQILSQYE